MPEQPETEVHPQFRHRLRELRGKAGYSLRVLASKVNYSHSYLWELEAGIKQPSQQTADRLDAALSGGGALTTLVTARLATLIPETDTDATVDIGLEFVSDWRRSVDSATVLWRWDTIVRHQHIDVPFAAERFLPPAVRWLTAPRDEHPIGRGTRVVGAPDIEMIRQLGSTLRMLDNHYGGGHIYSTVVRFLHNEIGPMLRGRYSKADGLALFAAASEMTLLAGWAAYDCGLHGVAQRYFIQSLRLAATGCDRPLGAEILAAMSHQSAYLHASAEAVDLARVAARTASEAGMAAIEAEAAVLEARGHAVGGAELECARSLDRAEHLLDQADRNSDPQWISYFDEAYLSAKFGQCFAALGRGALAQRFAARSLNMDSRYVRGRQFNLALMATAHVEAGEVEQAASVGMEAICTAEGLQSARAIDYIESLAQRLGVHVGLPAVQEFADRAAQLIDDRSPLLVALPASP